MQDIFLKIANHEIPAHIIFENETHMAFLDINPITPGHTVVIPKVKSDYLFDLSDSDYTALLLAAKKVAIILKDKLHCERIGMVVEGFEIPHVHIKLIPLNDGHDLNQTNARPATTEYLTEMLAKLTN